MSEIIETTGTETTVAESFVAEELDTVRQVAAGLSELWDSLYDSRGAIAPPDDEGGYHINSAVRALTKALDGVTEAQEHLSAAITSIQKELGRSK